MGMCNYDYSDFEGEGDPDFWRVLRVISRCRSLQGLNLYHSLVTNRGLCELARLPNLIHLELAGNRDITDAGLVHLSEMKSLRKLGLNDTNVSKSGVDKLQAALPGCEIWWDGMLQ